MSKGEAYLLHGSTMGGVAAGLNFVVEEADEQGHLRIVEIRRYVYNDPDDTTKGGEWKAVEKRDYQDGDRHARMIRDNFASRLNTLWEAYCRQRKVPLKQRLQRAVEDGRLRLARLIYDERKDEERY